MLARTPTFAVLDGSLDEAPAEHGALDWPTIRPGDRSFGLVLLLLAILGPLPGVSAFAAVLPMVPAAQTVLARPAPAAFPGRVGARRFEATKRAVGSAVLSLAANLLAPLPPSNIAPALAVVLIALACPEEDGRLLCAALASALAMLAAAAPSRGRPRARPVGGVELPVGPRRRLRSAGFPRPVAKRRDARPRGVGKGEDPP